MLLVAAVVLALVCYVVACNLVCGEDRLRVRCVCTNVQSFVVLLSWALNGAVYSSTYVLCNMPRGCVLIVLLVATDILQ